MIKMNILRFKKLKNWKIVLIVLLGVLIFGIGQVKIAHAWHLFTLADITANAISAVAQVVGYFFGFIAGIFLTIDAYLVKVALNINFELLKSPVVQTGWQIVLNFTNLGFVLAIIVMAFATIFRVETYAMKKTLWKLIVAALLVNFSLVIAGAFINISDVFSRFFIDRIGGVTGPAKWADAFASMFRAQALLKVEEVAGAKGFIDTATGVVNMFGPLALQNFASIFFVALFTVFAAITLLATAVMLLIRYVFLGILLLLSPIVWLLWIFPSTKSLWQKWWSQFLRWTFFAPIMLFFISLSMSVMKYQPEAVRKITQDTVLTGNVKLTLGVEVIGEMVIVIGLVIGGLFTANSLGIIFAGKAYGWAQSVGKGFGSWAGRKGLQYGTGWARYKGAKEGAKSLAERTQEWAAGRKTTVGRWSAGLISQGTARLAAVGGEDLVKKSKEQIKGKSLLEKKSMLPSASAPMEIAILEDLAASKDLENEDMKQYLSPKEKSLFARFGHGKGFNGVEKTVGKSAEMMDAALKKDPGALAEATDKFVKALKLDDIKKGQWNDIYAEKPAFKLDKKTNRMLADYLTSGLVDKLPGAFAKINPQIKGKNFDSYENTIRYQINLFEKAHPEALDEQGKSKARKSFEKNLGWLTLGITPEEMAKPEGT